MTARREEEIQDHNVGGKVGGMDQCVKKIRRDSISKLNRKEFTGRKSYLALDPKVKKSG